MEQPVRKPNRLREYDYSRNGAYFVTFCTEGKHKLLGKVVGGGVLDAPEVQLTEYGQIIKEQLETVNTVYQHVQIDKYVIMPNHVHLIVFVHAKKDETACTGTSRTPSPTNAVIPSLISTIKRFSNRRIGFNIWQRSYYDHVIRDEKDYLTKWNYIDTNPAKWQTDDYYIPEGL